MSGIAGYISFGRPVDDRILNGMSSALAHRGPNHTAIWTNSKRNLGLVYRGLSIEKDTILNYQPVTVRDRWAAVLDGIIDNQKDIQEQLTAEGVSSHSLHSTEDILLNACIKWGIDKAIEKLEGAFSFVFYDDEAQSVYLARDTIGEKPLFLFKGESFIAFASEIKAFKSLPFAPLEFDPFAVPDYLTFKTSPEPQTFFKNVEKISAAGILKISLPTKKISRSKYWDLCQTRRSNGTYEQHLEELQHLFDVTASSICSLDVPMGVFLSGGVDSTLILATLRKFSEKIDCFTVDYSDSISRSAGIDFARAEEAALAQGTNFHPLIVSSAEYIDALPEVLKTLDEPSAAPISVPMFLLAKFAAAKGVKMIFAGDGADLSFAGDSAWTGIQLFTDTFNRKSLPYVWMRQVLSNVKDPRNKLLQERYIRQRRNQPVFWSGSEDFVSSQKLKILSPQFRSHVNSTYERVIEAHWKRFKSSEYSDDPLKWMHYAEYQTRLPELILPRSDRILMAHAIQPKGLFVSKRLVETAFSIPSQHHLLHGSKSMTKEIASKSYRQGFYDSPKIGFHAPLNAWIQKDDKWGVFKKIGDFNSKYGIFNERQLDRELKEDARSPQLIYSLFVLSQWEETYFT